MFMFKFYIHEIACKRHGNDEGSGSETCSDPMEGRVGAFLEE